MEDKSSLDEFIAHYRIPLALGFVGFVLLIGGLLSSGIVAKTFFKSTKYPPAKSGQVHPSSLQNPLTIAVDVSGAVESPGVYTLPAESRIEDAIKAAGGVSEEADEVYLTKNINLAQRLSDGTKVYLPYEGDVAGAQSGIVDKVSQSGIINVNSATLDDLDKLSGVGPVTAQKIIDGRPYGGIEELLTKKAVSRSVYEKIKSSVSVY